MEVGEYRVVKGEHIKHRGIFSLEELLQAGSSWFFGYRYYWTEKEHTEKIKPEGTEFMIEWRALRRMDEYFLYNISVVLVIYRYKAVEMDIDTGRPRKGNGEIEITINAKVVTDYNNNFKTKFGNTVQNIYERYVIKDRISTFKKRLTDEVKDLKKNLKRQLEMYKE